MWMAGSTARAGMANDVQATSPEEVCNSFMIDIDRRHFVIDISSFGEQSPARW